MTDKQPIRLDMGCGPFRKEGFIGIDPYIFDDDNVINCQMWDLPYSNDTVDEIWSCHALEHVSKFQVMPTLLEWKRVIKPNGLITLEVPDLAWCVRTWLARQTTDWFLDTIFGMETHEGEFHRTGFTEKILLEYLQQADFILKYFDVVDSHGQPTLHAEFYRWNR